MMKPLLTASLVGTVFLGACAMGPQNLDNEGELDLKAEHALKPQNETVYHIQNIKDPGGKVFLFTDADSLGKCYLAIENREAVKESCAPGIAAKVEDGTMVSTIDCDNRKYASCFVRVIEGSEAGAKGEILWDWLKERQASKT